ncbi:MAG TPA: 5-formyltetrahydrofolate cyclo-ligase [Erysipelotrichaceae bacterium]|nr:5-formyltetrahydrofolate cyclo-ligase [Erysipelotrichaceae bacterium]HQB32427.1 5-formyltetrahydrofolate cyclo-ligase [Erysipelotrichaceae bacterium]
MNKSEQRDMIRKRLKGLSIFEKSVYSAIISQKLFDLIEAYKPAMVMSYMALENEVNLNRLHFLLNRKGIKLCFPKVEEDEIKAYMSYRFVKGSFNILEPDNGVLIKKEDIDIIVVPCVGFDRNKNRLGHGKGYYDKYLQDFTGKKFTPAFEVQKLKRIEVTENDVKINRILTEGGVYS